jgi:hypothetical protein
MRGQKFEDRKGRTVTVESIDGSIALLNNGERVAVSRLNDNRFFKPVSNSSNIQTVTPINENTNTNTTIPNINILDNNSRYERMINGSGISVGDEGHQIGRGAPVMGGNRPVTPYSEVGMVGVVESHNDNLRSIGKEVQEEVVPVTQRYQPPSKAQTEEARKAELLEKYGHTPQPEKPSKLNEFVDKIEGRTPAKETEVEVNNVKQEQVSKQYFEPEPTQPEENPVHKMFDAAKKVHSIKVNLKIDEKIPDKSVIKMMEENFDESAIEYYAKDIYNKLMSDPSIIEDQVKDAITKYVKSRSK